MNSMFLPYNFTLSYIIKYWGLRPQDFLSQIYQAGFKLDSKFNKFTVLENEKLIMLFDVLKEKIIENSQKEYEAFLLYIRNNNIHGNIAVVDIGWNGNMQKAFQKVLSNAHIFGFYLAIREHPSMKGYLSSDFLLDIYIHASLEIFFMAYHGTALRYAHNGGVELDTFEYADTDTEKAVRIIQKDAIQFINDFKHIGELLKNEPTVYAGKLLTMFKSPTLKEVGYCQNLQAWDDEWFPIAKPRTLRTYIKNPRALKEDLLRNSWKIGFLKRVFQIPAPYYWILKVLRQYALYRLRALDEYTVLSDHAAQNGAK